MDKGISFQGFVPVHGEPSDRSEIITQVLFGERFRILKREGSWLHINSDLDSTEGWIRDFAIQRIEAGDEVENRPMAGFRMVSAPSVRILDRMQGQQLIIPAGSVWPADAGTSFSLQGRVFELISGAGIITPGPENDPEEIGKGLLSLPCLPGGRSGFGFDGSGLVQTISRMLGIALPRECQYQSGLGTTINFMHEIRPGDLAFFDDPDGEIHHAGIVLNEGRILHAYGSVRIDKLDHQGIFNTGRQAYTHRLRIIKRMDGQ